MYGAVSQIEEKKTESKRVKATKARLQAVFLELLREKPVENITVRELTERAQMNRTSFYRYYLDVYDLYDQIADSFSKKFQQFGIPILLKLLQGKSISFQDTAFEFLFAHRDVMKVCLQDPKLLNKVKEKTMNFFKNLMQITDKDAAIDFILEFYIAGQVGLLSYWIQHPETLSEDEFISLMQNIIFRGPLTVLKEKLPPDVSIQI